MIDLGEEHPKYVPSATLSRMIKLYHALSSQYTPYLASETNNIDIDTDQSFDKTMKQIYKNVEPFVVHVRSGNNNEMKTQMIDSLTKEHGFLHVDVQTTVQGEAERGTVIG